MCGIAGTIDFRKKVHRQDLVRQLASIKHRGPDSSGLHLETHAGLGVQRLSIIDLKTGDQPIYSERGDLVIVFNGEIYNYQELRRKYLQGKYHFSTKSDTEVVLGLFAELGTESFAKLNGMFAFAIWNTKSKELFLVRDSLGIKPLYVWVMKDKLVFGSETKAILASDQVEKKIDQHSLKLFSMFGYVPGPNSIFKGVKKLSPGHFLRFSRHGLTVEKYWDFNSNDFKEKDSLEETLEQAIVDNTVADVPVGLFLSGGIDSGLIAHFLAKNKKNSTSFSIGFEDHRFDELDDAQEIAKQIGMKNVHTVFGVKDLVSLFPKLNQKLDEPFSDPSIFPAFKLSELASESVKVVLSGDGGDELFGGYPTYLGHRFARFFSLFPDEVREWLAKSVTLFPYSFGSYDKKEVYEKFFIGLPLPLFLQHAFWQNLTVSDFFLKDASWIESQNWFHQLTSQINSMTTNRIYKTQLLDVYTYLVDAMMLKTDRASMFNSLEVRVPFLDPRLVAQSFQHKNHTSLLETKVQLRQMAIGKLPDSIVRKKKKGFGLPMREWIKGDLKNLVGDHLNNQELHRFFEKKDIRTAFASHLKGTVNNERKLWMWTMLSAWFLKWAH